MKTTRNLIFISLLLIFNSGCNFYEGCNRISIPKRDLLWIKGYNLHDRIVLKSDKGNFDTLELIEKTIEFTPCNKFELGPNQYEEFDYVFSSQKLKETENSHAGLSFSTDNSAYDGRGKIIRAFGLEWSSSDLDHDKEIHREKIKVAGIKDSIETFYCSKSNYSNSIAEIVSFNWSKKYGLVRYELKGSSEKYEYYKKCKVNDT